MSIQSDHDHEFTVGGGQVSLSDLGHLIPGMADIMPVIGNRVWKCYYAAQQKNKVLARFELKEAEELMEKSAVLRPKYAEDMEKFMTDAVATLLKSIEAEDWDGFEVAFTAMVDSANAYHEKYDKGFLRWKLPDTPPQDLDLTAQ